MAMAYLLTGANLGDRKKQLELAASLIQEWAGPITLSSGCYETAPWGKTDQPAFLNQALCVCTTLSPQELLNTLLQIEQQAGRVRSEKYGPRVLDIDILLYDQLVLQEKDLVIPHPALPARRFALLPLAEIAPTLWHPTEQCSISALLQRCSDPGGVIKVS
jgi:2-amino-4-hydroxy-6-hydroxymethyldihydropteridine diphosphokinase